MKIKNLLKIKQKYIDAMYFALTNNYDSLT